MARESNYSKILRKVFFDNYVAGSDHVNFTRDEFEAAADDLGLPRPKNLGDVVYSFRYRRPLPEQILSTAPEGMEWYIKGAGDGAYSFQGMRTKSWTRFGPDWSPHV